MENRYTDQFFPNPRTQKVYYTSPGDFVNNASNIQLPHNVFENTGYSFSNPVGLGHPVSSSFPNNMNISGNMNLNDNLSSSFPSQGNYPFGNFQWQPPVAVPNSPHLPQFNAHLGANVTNPFSVHHLQTRIIPPVVSEDPVEIAGQPSTSSRAIPPRPRETIPIYQARVCIQD